MSSPLGMARAGNGTTTLPAQGGTGAQAPAPASETGITLGGGFSLNQEAHVNFAAGWIVVIAVLMAGFFRWAR